MFLSQHRRADQRKHNAEDGISPGFSPRFLKK